MQTTYRAIANIPKTDKALSVLDSYALLFNSLERKLYKDLHINKLDKNKLKTEYANLPSFNARHFNSLHIQLSGRITSILELNKNYLNDAQQNLKSEQIKLNKNINSLKLQQKELNKYRVNNNNLSVSQINIINGFIKKLKTKIYYNKIRIKNIEQKIKYLLDIKTTGNPHLTFGSNKLFRQQFQINSPNKENKTQFKNHEQWKKEWQRKRSQSFLMVGSKDETAGNANCQITHIKDNIFNLQINLIPKASKLKDRLVNIELEMFQGADKIKQIIHNNLSKDKSLWQAITYRFYRNNEKNTWQIFISIDKSKIKPEIITDKIQGRIGVDINKDHLSVVEINQDGNLIKAFDIQLNLEGKTSNQAKDNIGIAIKKLTDYARDKTKGIVIENLDFSAKKKTLESGINKNYNRMLSSFCYKKIKEIILSRSLDKGIEVYEVNPAFTSMIGRIKYQQRYKLTTHQAAAFVIARRGLSIKKERHIALKNTNKPFCVLPVRNIYKTEGLYWKAINEVLVKARNKKAQVKRKRLFDLNKSKKSVVCSFGNP